MWRKGTKELGGKHGKLMREERGVQERMKVIERKSEQVLLEGLFFFNDTATTEIYTLALHDALPSGGVELRTGRMPSKPVCVALHL